MPWRVFITVGEASGDQHAGSLTRELKALQPDIIVEGIGGSEMIAAGANVFHDTVTRAAMGWKALFRYFELRPILKWSRRHFAENRPDLVICIDSWAMNKSWAKLAYSKGIPVMYYIAPQVWASRRGRIKPLRRYVNRVACILPFEEKYLRDNGVEATFVGHPLFDTLPKDVAIEPNKRFPNAPPVIGLIAGSRAGVARENFRNQLEVARQISAEFRGTTCLIPTMPATHGVVQRFLLEECPGEHFATLPDGSERIGSFTVGLNQFNAMVPRCDLCISVSGTATLHAAGHGAPQIVVYRLSPVIWNLFGRWIVKTRTFSLVNLLSDSHQDIVPEFIPWYGSNQPVADKALELLRNPEMLEKQRTQVQKLMGTLNRPGASRNAAEQAIDVIIGNRPTEIR
jgi:lipid-A-disaccharide synthase